MPKFDRLIRISVRVVIGLLALGLLSYSIFHAGPALVWKQIHAVGWGLGVIIVMGGFSQFTKTWAWRQACMSDISALSWSRSLAAQLVSDAIGQVGMAGKLLGEGMRISLVGSAVPLRSAISASAIDGGLHSLTAVVIGVLGITATLLIAPVPQAWRVYALLFAGALVALVFLAIVAVASRWPLVGHLARAIGRLPRLEKWVREKQPIIDAAENDLLSFYHEAPVRFWSNLGLNVLWHGLAILEVFLILRFMGATISMVGAFLVESLTKIIDLVGMVNPGNFGTYEAGNMLIAKIFGLMGTVGLTLALCRRVRAVFWAGVGVVCMVALKRAGKNESPIATGLDAAHALSR
jgi:hypothetical protein